MDDRSINSTDEQVHADKVGLPSQNKRTNSVVVLVLADPTGEHMLIKVFPNEILAGWQKNSISFRKTTILSHV